MTASDYFRTDLDRAPLERKVGKVWTDAELTKDFKVLNFLAPFYGVVRKSDGVKGTMQFQHRPRFYFAFETEG